MAGRWSDYSTVGRTGSWKTNLVWAPFPDLAFRGGVSRSVRAPNITELFRPEIGVNFRPADPCDAAQIDALLAEDPALGGNFLSNCTVHLRGIGLDPLDADGRYRFADPLSASFGGVTSGNPDLREETARTTTYGVALQPAILPGVGLAVDFWEIEIEDAIESVTSQNIVDGCYRGAALNPDFCGLFTRNEDPASAQFGGFDFLRTVDINFARLRTSGLDFSARYDVALGAHGFNVAVAGTYVRELDFHTDPGARDDVDPELGEVRRPELAGNVHLRWNRRNLGVDWHAQYLGGMLLSFVEIETATTLYGDAVFMDATWLHNVNVSYAAGEATTLAGGIRNLTGARPFATDRAFPVSPPGPHVLPARRVSLAVGVPNRQAFTDVCRSARAVRPVLRQADDDPVPHTGGASSLVRPAFRLTGLHRRGATASGG